jgi:hypothetical protein
MHVSSKSLSRTTSLQSRSSAWQFMCLNSAVIVVNDGYSRGPFHPRQSYRLRPTSRERSSYEVRGLLNILKNTRGPPIKPADETTSRHVFIADTYRKQRSILCTK